MVQSSAYIAPPRTPLELFEMLPVGTRAELIDNAIYMPPSPSFEHQTTSMALSAQLYNFLKATGKGEVVAAPMDVYLGDRRNAVQPDIIVMLKESLPKLTGDKRRITGVPDLIIEILSEGNKDYDMEKKKDLYERFGVKEYFIVAPDTGLAFHYYLREHGRYELAHQHIRKIESVLLGEVFGW
jgi:Uma2 family endonuclease